MIKHTQAIRWQKQTNCLSVFDHFVGLALKGLKSYESFVDVIYLTDVFFCLYIFGN